MSSVVGYASDYELAQFVYDLWLWSSLGGAKHASGVQMRVALAGKPFSPEYWRTRHFALLDLQKQLGYPTLFVTIAPYEWSSPYHAFLEDELLRTFKTRLHLPGPESFHLAHILTQAALGLVTGWNKKGRGGWTQHVLSDPSSAAQGSVLNLFGRIEFQDGKRKRGARNERLDYHGSGRPHVHFLVWLRHPESLPWSEIVCGHLPSDNAPMEQIARSSQISWTGSGWPRREASTVWDQTAGRLHLHHPESAWKEGMRAYMPDVLASLKCHMDVQASDGRGMLLRYVAGYVPKFSDSFQPNWLDDVSSDYALARRVLTQYQPLEPEMWLQLGAHLFRQCFAGGGLSRFVVPVPWKDDLPQRGWGMMIGLPGWPPPRTVGPSSWPPSPSPASTTSTTSSGACCTCPSASWTTSGTRAWSSCRRSSKATGCTSHLTTFVRCSDCPHESYQGLGMALVHAGDYWRDQQAVRADMELEAQRDPFIESNLAMLRAHIALVDLYWSGQLVHGVDPVPEVSHTLGSEQITLEREQQQVVEAIGQRVALALCWAKASACDWDEGEGEPEEPSFTVDWSWDSAFAVLGPAGSGKSTTVMVAVEKARAAGARRARVPHSHAGRCLPPEVP